MSARKLIWIVVGVLVVILYLGSNVLELIVDYIWFGTQGYDQVFQRVLTAKILIGILGGAVTALFLFGNLYIALRTLGDLTQYLPAEIVITPLGQLLTQKLVRRTALGLSLLGMAAIDSVPRSSGPDFAQKHLQFMFIGILAAIVIAAPHFRIFQRLSYPLMLLVIGLLLILSVLSAGPAVRADFAAGMAAFERGEDAAALELWLPLAGSGLVEAQFNVGLVYSRDSGVPVDDVEALRWFLASSEQGYVRGQYRAAEMYEAGRGTKVDLVQAYVWYSLAADRKYLDARKRGKRVAKLLPPKQLALAQMHARHWKQDHGGKGKKESP